tara:strand:- start:93 stop:335 length:243 start_codon:yes stop_codon:yes gene_type:complete
LFDYLVSGRLVGHLSVVFTEAQALPDHRNTGSFTTFSTFGYDMLCLLQENNTLLALANVGAHMLLGLLCVYAGYTLSTLG